MFHSLNGIVLMALQEEKNTFNNAVLGLNTKHSTHYEAENIDIVV